MLRGKDVKPFKPLIAYHPMPAARLSRCLDLGDETAESQMQKTVLIRSTLREIHSYAVKRLNERGIEAPRTGTGKRKKRPFPRRAER
ncbi:MAG: hypothetical protein R6X27_17855 [Candidatus Desulfacyla sp.]